MLWLCVIFYLLSRYMRPERAMAAVPQLPKQRWWLFLCSLNPLRPENVVAVVGAVAFAVVAVAAAVAVAAVPVRGQ